MPKYLRTLYGGLNFVESTIIDNLKVFSLEDAINLIDSLQANNLEFTDSIRCFGFFSNLLLKKCW